MVAWRSKRLSAIGELFFAYDDEGREEGFLADGGGPGVRRMADGAGLVGGLVTRLAFASCKNRSPCLGWRDEWRELELGV